MPDLQLVLFFSDLPGLVVYAGRRLAHIENFDSSPAIFVGCGLSSGRGSRKCWGLVVGLLVGRFRHS